MPIRRSIPTRRIYVSLVLLFPELLDFSRPKTDVQTYFSPRRTHSMVKEIDFMAPLLRTEGFAWVTIGSNFNMFSELRFRHLRPRVLVIVDVDSEIVVVMMGLASLQAVGFSCGFNRWELIRIYLIRCRSVQYDLLVP